MYKKKTDKLKKNTSDRHEKTVNKRTYEWKKTDEWKQHMIENTYMH